MSGIGPGKGDKRRPRLVSREEYEDNWNRIFGKKKEKEEKKEEESNTPEEK